MPAEARRLNRYVKVLLETTALLGPLFFEASGQDENIAMSAAHPEGRTETALGSVDDAWNGDHARP